MTWIGVNKFMELVGVSRSKITTDIRDGVLDHRYYGAKLMINYAKFAEDLENRSLELPYRFTKTINV
jgi:hypothetical protein